MVSCRNTGFRSIKFYNNKESKHANEFIISGAINLFCIWRQKKQTNKPTLTSNLKVCQVNSSKFVMDVPNYYLLQKRKVIDM